MAFELLIENVADAELLIFVLLCLAVSLWYHNLAECTCKILQNFPLQTLPLFLLPDLQDTVCRKILVLEGKSTVLKLAPAHPIACHGKPAAVAQMNCLKTPECHIFKANFPGKNLFKLNPWDFEHYRMFLVFSCNLHSQCHKMSGNL